MMPKTRPDPIRPAGPGLDSETRECAKRPLLTLHTRNFPTSLTQSTTTRSPSPQIPSLMMPKTRPDPIRPAGPGLDSETRECAKRPHLTLHTRNFPTSPTQSTTTRSPSPQIPSLMMPKIRPDPIRPAGPGLDSETRERAKRPHLALHAHRLARVSILRPGIRVTRARFG